MSIPKWERDISLPANISSIPDMLSGNEKSFLYWYMAEEYDGTGEVVELGCYLGASTATLISGLNKNPKIHDPMIHTYDRFIWGETELDYWLNSKANAETGQNSGQYKIGESFESIFRQHIAPWENQIQVNSGDLLTKQWEDEPIGFLFVDVMKTWALATHVAQQFFPALVPQKSYIYHQDFYDPHCSWVHLLMYRLRSYFEPVYAVEEGGVLYRCIQEITPSACEHACDFDHYTIAEINSAFEYSLSQITETQVGHQWRMSAGLIAAYLHYIERIPGDHKNRALTFPIVHNHVRRIFGTKKDTTSHNKTAYVICTTQRSGSNMLCSLLENTSLAGAPSEMFYEDTISNPKKFHQFEDEFENYFFGMIQKTSSENGVFGFKLMYDQLARFSERLASLTKDSSQQSVRELLLKHFAEVHFIYLRRRNKLQQAISLSKANQTGVWWIPTHKPVEKPQKDPVYDPKHIRSCLSGIVKQDANWQLYFEKYNIAPLVVYYEDLKANPEAVKQILDYLGIVYPQDLNIQINTKKQATQIDREWMVRYLYDQGYLTKDKMAFLLGNH